MGKLWIGDKMYIVDEEVLEEYERVCSDYGLMQVKLFKIKQVVESLKETMKLSENEK